MAYFGPIGFGAQIPAHQTGRQIGLWRIRGLGYQKYVIRGVLLYSYFA